MNSELNDPNRSHGASITSDTRAFDERRRHVPLRKDPLTLPTVYAVNLSPRLLQGDLWPFARQLYTGGKEITRFSKHDCTLGGN